MRDNRVRYKSQRCECGHVLRWIRSAEVWRCTMCMNEYTDEEVKNPTERVNTDTAPIIQMFGNHPQGQQPPQQATATTQAGVYHLRDEK